MPRRASCEPRGGFTLLEMLLVMAVLGLALSLITPQRPQTPTAAMVAAELADALRQTRARALRSGRAASLTLNLDSPGYQIDTKPERRLSSGVHLQIETTVEAVITPSRAGVLFAADGSASGGRIIIRTASGVSVIRIGWFDGRITIDAEP